jgi:hypothetical protein
MLEVAVASLGAMSPVMARSGANQGPLQMSAVVGVSGLIMLALSLAARDPKRR